MNKVDYYASIEAYKERNFLAHAGVQPKNPRKDHKYLYIDKNGRYVYDEPKGNTSRPYSSPNTTGGKDANSYIQSNYGRTQESMKNTSTAKQAQNSWAKSNEKTSSSTGRPYSTPNSYNMQTTKEKDNLALKIAKNQSLAKIKEKQDAWKKEQEKKAADNEEWKKKWKEKDDDERDPLSYFNRLAGYTKDNIVSRPYSNPNTDRDYEGKIGVDISGTDKKTGIKRGFNRYSENVKKIGKVEEAIINATKVADLVNEKFNNDLNLSRSEIASLKEKSLKLADEVESMISSIENPKKREELYESAKEAIGQLRNPTKWLKK